VYVSGSIGFVFNPTFFKPFTPYTLILTCFVFLVYPPLHDKKFILSFARIAAMGYLIEVIGVKTGVVFGKYTYGNALGYKLFDVPLIISINWALLICAGIITVSSIVKNKLLVLGISALLITLIDIIIEHVAYKLDFWQFENGMPSLHNYIGWFVVACSTPYFFYSTIIKGNRLLSLIILILQLFFFTFLLIFF
jgi:putative membrane protein